VELGDADLENFAAFAKLLSKRLKGISPDQIDLTGLILAGYKIKQLDEGDDHEIEKNELKPITANEAHANDREKEFFTEIIERMNQIFGDVSDDIGQRHFTAQIVNIAMSNNQVNEQIDKNTKEQALQGVLPDIVKDATVNAMRSHNDLARVLLKDSQTMESFFGLIYDIVKNGDARDLIQQQS
jgi:type I restriction enzyme R subunit